MREGLSDRFWQAHNELTLRQYFHFDPTGEILAPKAEFYELLGKLAPYLNDPTTDISDIEGDLTDEEKYVLFYTVLQLRDPIYDIGAFFFDLGKQYGGVAAFWQFMSIVRANNDEQFDIPIITEWLAFMNNGDNFTSSDREGTIQSESGFMDFYDPAVAMLGMDIDTKIVVFEHGEKEYRLQLWDGEYGWHGFIGGEVGLYYRDIDDIESRPYISGKNLSPEYLKERLPFMSPLEMDNYFINYKCLPEGEQLPMVLEIYTQDGTLLITNDTRDYANADSEGDSDDDDHWWNFATDNNSLLDLTKEDVYTKATITIEDDGMREAIVAAIEQEGDMTVRVRGDNVIIYWGKE
jgi:hypothetical protein